MRINARNKRPKITFGLGKTELRVEVGDKVTVFQNSIYLDADFDTGLEISGEGMDNRKLSNYNFLLSPEAVGVYELRAYVESKGAELRGTSNKITLIVN